MNENAEPITQNLILRSDDEGAEIDPLATAVGIDHVNDVVGVGLDSGGSRRRRWLVDDSGVMEGEDTHMVEGNDDMYARVLFLRFHSFSKKNKKINGPCGAFWSVRLIQQTKRMER